MNYKWIGAILIITGSGGFGFLMAWNYKRELESLRQLVKALEYMESDLEYRLTTLSVLSKKTAEILTGSMQRLFFNFAKELDGQMAPDAAYCMTVALNNTPELPKKTVEYLRALGQNLGVFDLQGQLRGLESVRSNCMLAVTQMEQQRPQRVRSYETLGLCAGAALAILLI
ncbi:MAG: stage III sporulation protein AB [Oscillospiraceae bacterium]|nr:stage III sporulation protein AB [Oscillospiraceae bacterium]